MANYDGLVLVAGASGDVGRRVVKTLLQEGIAVRALVRNKAKAAELEKLGASVVLIDLTDEVNAPKILKKAMEGVTAVISALGTRQPFSFTNGLRQVDYFGNRRLVDAALAAGVNHFILNSTMGLASPPTIFKPFSFPFYPKWEAEAYLVQSGLTYTIIRPGGLVNSDAELKGPAGWKHSPVLATAKLNGEDGFGGFGRIHRQDVAELLVKSLWTEATHKRIFEALDRASVRANDRAKILKGVFQN
ncbi:MAG: SDR family oxidoreductase [Chloroflexota bacterium]|nr:SDR family oxidoreductase [Chloroflexota bacterium]